MKKIGKLVVRKHSKKAHEHNSDNTLLTICTLAIHMYLQYTHAPHIAHYKRPRGL